MAIRQTTTDLSTIIACFILCFLNFSQLAETKAAALHDPRDEPLRNESQVVVKPVITLNLSKPVDGPKSLPELNNSMNTQFSEVLEVSPNDNLHNHSRPVVLEASFVKNFRITGDVESLLQLSEKIEAEKNVDHPKSESEAVLSRNVWHELKSNGTSVLRKILTYKPVNVQETVIKQNDMKNGRDEMDVSRLNSSNERHHHSKSNFQLPLASYIKDHRFSQRKDSSTARRPQKKYLLPIQSSHSHDGREWIVYHDLNGFVDDYKKALESQETLEESDKHLKNHKTKAINFAQLEPADYYVDEDTPKKSSKYKSHNHYKHDHHHRE